MMVFKIEGKCTDGISERQTGVQAHGYTQQRGRQSEAQEKMPGEGRR